MPKVTSFGDYAFDDCDALISISFPCLTELGDDAFEYCDNLTTVDLPSLTSVGTWFCEECPNLTTVNLPNVTTIDDDMFYDGTSQIYMKLGTNPPSITVDTFEYYFPEDNESVIIVPVNSISDYDNSDGNADDKWYGWIIEGRSTESIITEFRVNNQVRSTIDQANNTIQIIMPYGTDRANLAPEITVSNLATIFILIGLMIALRRKHTKVG